MIVKNSSKARTQLPGWKVAALAIASALLLAGCAGNPPNAQFAVSKSAVNEAVSSGAVEFAAIETKSAQDKLKQAELQMQGEGKVDQLAYLTNQRIEVARQAPASVARTNSTIATLSAIQQRL